MVSACDVYHEAGRGYIVVPIAGRADLWATTALYPAQPLSATSDEEELGLALLNALRRSEHARPQMLSQADRFWIAMGCASYQDFCRRFAGVAVERRGYRLRLVPLVPDGVYGGYRLDEKASVELFRYVSAAEIGDAVTRLLGQAVTAVPSHGLSHVVTLDGLEVTYRLPPEGLLDRGDAGGDFYRAYALQGAVAGWVGFLIGERYGSIDAEGIRGRWEEEYGTLDPFGCDVSSADGSLRLHAKASDVEVRSRIWPHGRDWLEVRSELSCVDDDPAATERARRLLAMVMDSCEVVGR